MTSHVLCDCEELAVLRFRHLGPYVLKISDFASISISMVLHFVQSTRLLKPQTKGCTKNSKQSRCRVHCSAHPNLLYLLYPIPITPTHLPHYPILKSPQSTFFPQCDRLSFVSIYIYIYIYTHIHTGTHIKMCPPATSPPASLPANSQSLKRIIKKGT